MRKKFLGVFLSVAVLLLSVFSASAADINVRNGNDEGVDSLRWALEQAKLGDRVVISPSVKKISLKTEIIFNNSLTIGNSLKVIGNGATISGIRADRLFSIKNGEISFESFTFTNGKAFASNGGAVNIEGVTAKADFLNCTFFDNGAGENGGAVCINSASLNATTFYNCTIANNSSTKGGGVAIMRGRASFSACVIVGNKTSLTGAEDVYADQDYGLNGTRKYNVVGKVNIPSLFSEADNNSFNVEADSIFQPLSLEKVNDTDVLKLRVNGPIKNVAFNFIPTGALIGTPVNDQRGADRPQMGAIDAGAYEAKPVLAEQAKVIGYPYIQVGNTEPYKVSVSPLDAVLDVKNWLLAKKSG